ncbi:MAG: hypothetical protein BAJALOKI2v1_900010 [Promethearchaeota archaeon]|nr:MAG: hypothetical protein BAJALOKI2v1_900010 [Candidatus Lokiarchaeota archaeon]
MVPLNSKKHKIIVLDSNFLFLPSQFQTDYLEIIEMKLGTSISYIIYQQILDELNAKKRRRKNSSKFRRDLNLGLQYLEKSRLHHNIDFIGETKNKMETTDEFLIRKCVNLKRTNKSIYLATNDQELRKKAKKRGVNIIYLRQKSYLVIERA